MTTYDAKLTIPTDEDIVLAGLLGRQLSHYPDLTQEKTLRVRVLFNEEEENLEIPLTAFMLFKQILSEMAKGNAVTFFPVASELTTQQAAEMLNVSRPYLIELLNNKVIPYRKVGTHRRLLAADVIVYQGQVQKERSETLQRLIELDQELGLD
jgi:excisionase family DNA binding protein